MTQEYEMGYTAREFEQVLHGQFITTDSSYHCCDRSASEWEIDYANGGAVTITIEPQPPRELGMFSLPVLRVLFHFTDTDETAQKSFMARFFKYFHKGGG